MGEGEIVVVEVTRTTRPRNLKRRRRAELDPSLPTAIFSTPVSVS